MLLFQTELIFLCLTLPCTFSRYPAHFTRYQKEIIRILVIIGICTNHTDIIMSSLCLTIVLIPRILQLRTTMLILDDLYTIGKFPGHFKNFCRMRRFLVFVRRFLEHKTLFLELISKSVLARFDVTF